jgi:predicted alpha/beta superfamily hydrolase
MWRLGLSVTSGCIAALVAGGANGAWAERPASPNEVTFNLGKRYTIASAVLDGDRDVVVRLPAEHDRTGWEYPALYFLGSEGRARFALAAAALEYMAAQGQVPPIALVGVELPEGNFGLVPREEGDGGTQSADRYGRFLQDEVFPFVERNFPTNGYRILYGGSNSGVGVLYAFFSGKVTSQAVIASSPMLGWCRDLIFKVTLSALQRPGRDPCFLYLIASDDDFGRVARHIGDYVALLESEAPDWLSLRATSRANEGHVPEADLALALRAIFEGYNPVESLTDAASLRRHYQALSLRLGMRVEPPEALLFDVGFDLVSAGQADQGREVFALHAERYPWSARAFAGLGFALKEYGNAAAARQALERALDLDANNPFARRLLGELAE